MSHSELFSLYAGIRTYADTLQTSVTDLAKPEKDDLLAELRYHALTIHLNTQLEAARQVQTGWEQLPQLQEEITGLLAPLSAAIIHHARLSTRTDYQGAVEQAVESTYADPEHDTALSALDRQTLTRVAMERGCAKEEYVQTAALPPEQSSASEITVPTGMSAEPESPVSAAPTISSIFRQLSIVPNKPTDELSLGVTLIARGILTREQWRNLPPGFARSVLDYVPESPMTEEKQQITEQVPNTLSPAAIYLLGVASKGLTVSAPEVCEALVTMHLASPDEVAADGYLGRLQQEVAGYFAGHDEHAHWGRSIVSPDRYILHRGPLRSPAEKKAPEQTTLSPAATALLELAKSGAEFKPEAVRELLITQGLMTDQDWRDRHSSFINGLQEEIVRYLRSLGIVSDWDTKGHTQATIRSLFISRESSEPAALEALFAPQNESERGDTSSTTDTPSASPSPDAALVTTTHEVTQPIAAEPAPGPKLTSILEPVTKRPRRPARPATAPPPVRVAASTPMRRQGPSFHEVVRRDRIDYMEEAPDIVEGVLKHLSQSNGHADAHLLTTLYAHAGDDLERREFFMLLQQMEEAGMIVRSRSGTDGPYVAHLVTQEE